MSSSHRSPVIIGGDIGAYSIARSFHEAFGVKSTIVAQVAGGPVRHSKILDVVTVPDLNDDAAFLRELLKIGKKSQHKRLLLGSGDWLVRRISAHRAALEDYFTIPYVDLDVMDTVTVKRNFSKLCEELGIPHPKTRVHRVGVDDPSDPVELEFPVVAKPGDSSAYKAVKFPGKKKVFHVADAEELADIFRNIAASSYRGDLIVQERVPGPDSHMRVLTCYSDADGDVNFASSGQVLLEEHTPGALGNPAVVMSGPVDDAIVKHAEKLLKHIGWRGFSNFDLKFDERTGQTVFFELNPRLGRSNYYLNVAGQNPAEIYVDDFLAAQKRSFSTAEDSGIFAIVPRATIRKFIAPQSQRNAALRVLKHRGKRNPLWYWPVEKNPRRLFYVLVALINQHRKFKRHFPREQ